MSVFKNADGKSVLSKIVKAIQDNKAYLSKVDGLIGDGDHGMNMNKGFTLFEQRFADKEFSFTDGMDYLGTILFTEIGGSMGPIYGTLFCDFAEAGENLEVITVSDLAYMLKAGLEGLQDIVEARVGDKTLIDSLSPAVDALLDAEEKGMDFFYALENMKKAAIKGRDSTKEMISKFGRSSRLGERSRGVLDAGSVSCCIILEAMADGINEVTVNDLRRKIP